MDSARWDRIQNLFHEAADLSPADQKTFLQEACHGDQQLLTEVQAMLHQDAGGHSFLDRNLADLAKQTLANSAPASLLPKTFGPYRILKLLGEGGMGVVYLAERTDLGTQVAVKVLRDAWLSPARRERFASEQRTLAQLNHPSIARLYDADTLDNGTPWFVMEFVDGIPITQYCREHKSSVEQRLQLFRSVCEAVQHAHSNAVIHRDLKPSNILVKRDGSVRLLDFGIAKQLESLDLPIDQTMTGLRMMTPAYASPEQVRGDQVGVSTDVYSLGVILYELLTGQLPFDLTGLTPAEAATIITEHDSGKPSSAAKRISHSDPNSLSVGKTAWADLDVLCLTAMHKDPLRRYRSVEAQIRDVDHYLNGEPLEARPDALEYRIGKFVRRHQRAVAAAAIIFAVIVGLVAFFTMRLAKARDAAVAEAARTQRIQQFMLNLFEGGHQESGPSENLRVIALLDRGQQEARALNQDPRAQAELYETLGGIYQKLGKFDQADSLLQAALNRQKSISGPNSTEAANDLVALGFLRADQGNYKEAENLTREALVIDQSHVPQNSRAVAKATGALGQVLETAQLHDQAIPILEQAVRLQSVPGAEPDLARTLISLAEANFLLGHYGQAESLNERALALDRQIYGEKHPLVAGDLLDLGNVQQQLGHYPEAEHYFRQALDINAAWYGNDNPETASAMTSLAQALAYENRYDEAEVLLRQALAIQENVYGKVHVHVAFALNTLGQLAIKRGDLQSAESDFSRVIEIYRAVYGDSNSRVAIAISNLAGVYSQRKEYARAEQLYRDAVERFTKAVSADDVNTGIAHLKLGRTLLREKRYQDAEPETRAGYEILIKQTSASTSFIHAAREDLTAEYEALNQPEKAARFRAELANSTPTTPR
jgi:eukaryotic-like serine/threonine-protein kinase